MYQEPIESIQERQNYLYKRQVWIRYRKTMLLYGMLFVGMTLLFTLLFLSVWVIASEYIPR